MILFTILALILIILAIITIVAVSIGGSIVIVLFGDVFVCAAIIIWIMKKLISKKK